MDIQEAITAQRGALAQAEADLRDAKAVYSSEIERLNQERASAEQAYVAALTDAKNREMMAKGAIAALEGLEK